MHMDSSTPTDPPSQPRLTANASRIDVETSVHMHCQLNSTQQTDIGNPAFDRFLFQNASHVLQNSTQNTWLMEFNSVNDSGGYTCVASNVPLIGRDYSETSEELVMTVTGKSKELVQRTGHQLRMRDYIKWHYE